MNESELLKALQYLWRAEVELSCAKAVFDRMGQDEIWRELEKADMKICVVLNRLRRCHPDIAKQVQL